MTAHLPQISRSQGSTSPSRGKAIAALAIKDTNNDITLRYAPLCRPFTPQIACRKMLVLFAHRPHHLNRRARCIIQCPYASQVPRRLVAGEVRAA